MDESGRIPCQVSNCRADLGLRRRDARFASAQAAAECKDLKQFIKDETAGRAEICRYFHLPEESPRRQRASALQGHDREGPAAEALAVPQSSARPRHATFASSDGARNSASTRTCTRMTYADEFGAPGSGFPRCATSSANAPASRCDPRLGLSGTQQRHRPLHRLAENAGLSIPDRLRSGLDHHRRPQQRQPADVLLLRPRDRRLHAFQQHGPRALARATEQHGVTHMSLVNFRLETDSDGIALITWDMPGRSMNVLNTEVIAEIAAFVDQVASDPAIKGAVITSGKEGFSAGADLTMLQGMGAEYARVAKARGRGGGDARLLRGRAQSQPRLPQARDLRQAVRRGDQRRLHGRRVRACARLPLSHRRRQRQGARRPAGDQGRPVPRRRRHAARRAADADARRSADAVQGRPDPPRRRQEDGPRPRRRAARRDRRSAPRTG